MKEDFCSCVNCQIIRLAEESPENAPLMEQWQDFFSFLVEEEMVSGRTTNFRIMVPVSTLGKVADEFGLDPRVKGIFLDTLGNLEAMAFGRSLVEKLISSLRADGIDVRII